MSLSPPMNYRYLWSLSIFVCSNLDHFHPPFPARTIFSYMCPWPSPVGGFKIYMCVPLKGRALVIRSMKRDFGLAASIPNAKSEIHRKAKVMRALSAHEGQPQPVRSELISWSQRYPVTRSMPILPLDQPGLKILKRNLISAANGRVESGLPSGGSPPPFSLGQSHRLAVSRGLKLPLSPSSR